uniref:Uncharacterized protein n=1 Tax=Cacopsylla melanoneura TaxID=428564 RepID=A0A8D8RXQ0_9HEMI
MIRRPPRFTLFPNPPLFRYGIPNFSYLQGFFQSKPKEPVKTIFVPQKSPLHFPIIFDDATHVQFCDKSKFVVISIVGLTGQKLWVQSLYRTKMFEWQIMYRPSSF